MCAAGRRREARIAGVLSEGPSAGRPAAPKLASAAVIVRAIQPRIWPVGTNDVPDPCGHGTGHHPALPGILAGADARWPGESVQVIVFERVTGKPLDQKVPGSTPGGATESPSTTWCVGGLLCLWPIKGYGVPLGLLCRKFSGCVIKRPGLMASLFSTAIS